MATTPFKYQAPFPLGPDTTEYYLLTKDYVSVSEFEGTPVLKVAKEGLTAMANAAFRDVSFMLRRSHNEQVAKILSDPEASDNDKYVALTFLRNAEVAAKGVLPFCQDTGTAIIHGEKGHMSMMAYSKHTKILSMNGGFVTNAVCDSCTTVIPGAAGLKEKLEKELADLKRQNAVTEMAKTARKMLADEEINIPDELLGHLVSDNAEDTKTTVESFSKLYKAAVQAAVKEALKGNPPKCGSGGKSMTKEQIMAVSNPLERQKLIAENIALFQ